MRYSILAILIYSVLSFGDGKPETPAELEVAFKYINDAWEKGKVDKFKNKPEDRAALDEHFGLGLFLRNTLLRNHGESEILLSFFNKLGIFHIDDMSGIILTSYHRRLNNKEINLQEQVDAYLKYWKPRIDCENKLDSIAMFTFKRFEIGDTIKIEMPVGGGESAFDYECNLNWNFVDSSDLMVAGIIHSKFYSELPSKLEFTIKILAKNHVDTEIFMKKKSPGDFLNVRLRTCWHIN